MKPMMNKKKRAAMMAKMAGEKMPMEKKPAKKNRRAMAMRKMAGMK